LIHGGGLLRDTLRVGLVNGCAEWGCREVFDLGSRLHAGTRAAGGSEDWQAATLWFVPSTVVFDVVESDQLQLYK